MALVGALAGALGRVALAPVALAGLASLPGAAEASPPAIAADIAPVHGIVAAVMAGSGSTPALVIPPGVSPHDVQLRPSQARSLARAELVFRVGPTLSPAFDRALRVLAPKAEVITLIDLPQTVVWPARPARGALPPAEGESHVGATPAGAAPVDPHAWLDPGNGRAWTAVAAAALARKDPDHATLYATNARAAVREIAAAEAELAAAASALENAPILVLHDAFQYLERRYGLRVIGWVTSADATAPAAARVAALRARVRAEGARCILTEPLGRPGLAAAITDGVPVPLVAFDPLGSGLEPGPGFYPALLRDAARALRACAGDAPPRSEDKAGEDGQ